MRSTTRERTSWLLTWATRAVEIVGVRTHGVDETIAAVARRWRAVDRFELLASAHAALAAPDFEIEVSLHEAV